VGGIVLSDYGYQESLDANRQIKIVKENIMKSSTRDDAEGKLHQMKGKIKEIAGNLTDNPKLEAEGAGEKMAGIVQEKMGQVKKVWGK
jgi:uncharacterized protein YjbJ (UPF0337 family)